MPLCHRLKSHPHKSLMTDEAIEQIPSYDLSRLYIISPCDLIAVENKLHPSVIQ